MNFEDKVKMEQDFVSGFEYFLLRRYSLVQRNVYLIYDVNFKNEHVARSNADQVHHILQEIVSNDLKYGKELAEWNILVDAENIKIRMNCFTNWTTEKIPTGRGHNTIQQRAKVLGAFYSENIANGIFRGELILPISHNNK